MLAWIDFKEVTTQIQKGRANKTEWSTTTTTKEKKLFEKKVELAFTISDGIFEFQDVLQLDSTLKLVFLHLFGRFCSLLSRVWFFLFSCSMAFSLSCSSLSMRNLWYLHCGSFWLRMACICICIWVYVCSVKCESNPQTKHMLALSFEFGEHIFASDIKATLSREREPKCTWGIYIRGKTYRIIFRSGSSYSYFFFLFLLLFFFGFSRIFDSVLFFSLFVERHVHNITYTQTTCIFFGGFFAFCLCTLI